MSIQKGSIVTIKPGAVYGGAHKGVPVPKPQLAPKKHGVAEVRNGSARLKEINSWVALGYLTPAGESSPAKPSPQPPPPPKPPEEKPKAEQSLEYSQGLDDAITKMLGASADKYDKYKNGIRIFGTPHQFLPSADYRPIKDSNIGHSYLERILAEAPIIKIVPGVPNYLPDFSKQQKEAFHNYVSARSASDLANKIVKEDGRYFDFVADYVDYMRYVNLMCRISSIYLGIGDLTVPGTTEKYKSYDWARYYNLNKTTVKAQDETHGIFEWVAETGKQLMADMMGEYKHIQFYVDAGASYSESASNSTSQSQVVGLFDSAEGLMKDLSFLTSTDGKSFLGQDILGNAGAAADFLNQKITKGNGSALSRVLGLSAQILQGSNVIFPEIWQDSGYDKSYSFNLNLTSPYGDAESVFLNIYVPMMHILAFSLPRQTSANGFTSPSLVKAYSPGWFVCDMGMVTGVSIDKGPDKDWSITGLPTTVKISVTIKDLYSNLMISKSTKPGLFFNNNGLIEFLAVTCGVDISKPNFMLRIETCLNVLINKITDIPSAIAQEFIQAVNNALGFLFKL